MLIEKSLNFSSDIIFQNSLKKRSVIVGFRLEYAHVPKY